MNSPPFIANLSPTGLLMARYMDGGGVGMTETYDKLPWIKNQSSLDEMLAALQGLMWQFFFSFFKNSTAQLCVHNLFIHYILSLGVKFQNLKIDLNIYGS